MLLPPPILNVTIIRIAVGN